MRKPNEALKVKKNAETVEEGGCIACPVLMFISDGKQVSGHRIENAKSFPVIPVPPAGVARRTQAV